jgi:hypothetical protein
MIALQKWYKMAWNYREMTSIIKTQHLILDHKSYLGT